MVGEALEEGAEQLLGDLSVAQAEGQSAEVVGHLGVVGHQLEGGLVAGDRTCKVAAHLTGQGQHVPAEPAALVQLQGLHGQRGALVGFAGVERVDRALQQGLDRKSLKLRDCGVQSRQGRARC